MRKGGSKAKGAEYERDICRKLSLWVSHGKQEDVFWRSAMSGGRSTVAAKKGKRLATQAGDISCIHPIGQPFAEKYFIECKAYKDLNIPGLLKSTGHLVDFWLEAVNQAKIYKKEPLLIARQNNFPTLICTSERGAWWLKTDDWILWAPRIDMWIALFDEVMKQEYSLKGVP